MMYLLAVLSLLCVAAASAAGMDPESRYDDTLILVNKENRYIKADTNKAKADNYDSYNKYDGYSYASMPAYSSYDSYASKPTYSSYNNYDNYMANDYNGNGNYNDNSYNGYDVGYMSQYGGPYTPDNPYGAGQGMPTYDQYRKKSYKSSNPKYPDNYSYMNNQNY